MKTKHAKPKIFKKAINLESKKKFSSKNIIYFNIAGTQYHVKTVKQIQKLRRCSHFSEALIKHEYKNRFDEYACAVHIKSIKLGYVPKELNQKIISNGQKNIKYKFYVCSLPVFDFEDAEFCGPLVIGIRR